MVYVILFLALLVLGAGIGLLVLDSRRRAGANPAQPAQLSPADDTPQAEPTVDESKPEGKPSPAPTESEAEPAATRVARAEPVRPAEESGAAASKREEDPGKLDLAQLPEEPDFSFDSLTTRPHREPEAAAEPVAQQAPNAENSPEESIEAGTPLRHEPPVEPADEPAETADPAEPVEATEPVEPEEPVEPAAATEPAAVTEPAEPATEAETGTEAETETKAYAEPVEPADPSAAADAAEPAEASEPEKAEKAEKPERKVKHRAILPRALRRQRKAWAEANGFDYAKQDSYLVDEWGRGAASTGAAPRDIVTGNVYGHEMMLMDIGGINVMAMRTGATSDIVLDFRRVDMLDHPDSEDLLRAFDLAGFSVYATDTAVATRLADERVTVALEQLPEEVTAVWMESEWVLAQTTKYARMTQWDAMLAPLALLADAARVLPPRAAAGQVLRVEELDPSREIPAPLAEEAGIGKHGSAAHGGEEEERPLVKRPEEPVQLPSRVRVDTRGSMSHSALGANEVDAIADGKERPQTDASKARVPRKFTKGSSIFDDGEADHAPEA